ncbi:hypothetical protein VTL71DRAFT_9305, partial [Oculimacula yallundae]
MMLFKPHLTSPVLLLHTTTDNGTRAQEICDSETPNLVLEEMVSDSTGLSEDRSCNSESSLTRATFSNLPDQSSLVLKTK